jgi:hypothetical protein
MTLDRRYISHTDYWLLLRGGVVQCIPSTASISDLLSVPIWVLIPLIHPLSALWLHPRHLAVKQRGGEKRPWILLTEHLNHDTKGSLTCCKIMQYGASGFTSQPKEGVLQIFITIKNPSPLPGLNLHPLGPVQAYQPLHHRGDYTHRLELVHSARWTIQHKTKWLCCYSTSNNVRSMPLCCLLHVLVNNALWWTFWTLRV